MKELLPWGEVKKKDNARDRLRQCAGRDAQGFVACLTPFLGERLSHQFLEWTVNAHWKEIEDRVSGIRRRITWRSLFPIPVSRFWLLVRSVLGPVLHRLRRPLGCFVVLLGPDGSGKTTVAKELMAFWNREFHKDPLYIHGDFAILPRLRILRRIWAKLKGRGLPPDPDYTLRHAGAQVAPHSLCRSLLYLAYYFWGYGIGHVKIFLAKGKDRLVVADRYFYDYFFQRGNMKLPHWLLRMLSWFIPQPDLVVFLDGDPEVIYKRKNELTIEEIERQQIIIRKIVTWLPNVKKVRSDVEIDGTVQEIKEAMFSAIAKKNR